jgi:hypothetical protein
MPLPVYSQWLENLARIWRGGNCSNLEMRRICVNMKNLGGVNFA